jgi:hypothetical protein
MVEPNLSFNINDLDCFILRYAIIWTAAVNAMQSPSSFRYAVRYAMSIKYSVCPSKPPLNRNPPVECHYGRTCL